MDSELIFIDREVNVLDLFCGCGGFTTGLVDSGLNVIAGIDFWDKAIDTYKKNHNHKAIHKDLTEYTPEMFEKEYLDVKLDIIVGSPPCQGFSMGGKRDPQDKRNNLFLEFLKYLDYFKPKIFVMENVLGILSAKSPQGEKMIDIIMNKFNVNYNCTINKLCSSDFQVPQNRRRVIIVGVLKEYNFTPPEITNVSSENRIPVKNILLPREAVDKKYFLSEKAITGINRKKNESKIKGNGFGAQFLNLEKPSYTIPARYYKDGYDALVKYSENEIRRLTLLELKRIQTFPDDYIFDCSNKEAIMQIGNAVPVKLAYHIGLYLLDLFFNKL